MGMYSVNANEAKDYIIRCIKAGLVPFLKSSPGGGKSAIYKEIAEEFGLILIDLRLSMLEPTNLNGYPDLSSGIAKFVPFNLFPLRGDPIPEGSNGWMLLLDELPSAPRDVLAAAYKPILDHMVGDYHLHEKCVVVAAGNLDTDNAIVNDIGTALQSRMVHLKLKVDVPVWLNNVAFPNKYDSRIIAFLNYAPNKLMNFKPDHEDETFASPRTFSFLNSLIQGEEDLHALMPLIVGTVGAEAGLDFIKFSEIYKDLVSIDEVVDNPDTANVPAASANRWATVTHLTEALTKYNFKHVVQYMDRYPLDFKVLFAHMIVSTKPELLSEPAWGEVIKSVGKRIAELNKL